MIEEYNIWRKDNPNSSIIDFCNQYNYPFNLDTLTDIYSLSRVVSLEDFTPEIESNIKAEIIRVLNNIDQDTISEMLDDLKEEIEESLEDMEVEFEYLGHEFTYNYTYNIEIRVEDKAFNEFINQKTEDIEGFEDLLPSRQERCKQYIMARHVPKFLEALSSAIDQGLDINSPFELTYEGFTFSYKDIKDLPKIIYDEQIQSFIEEKLGDIEDHIDVDNDCPTKNNIRDHINAFNLVRKLIEAYDEAIFKDASEDIDLESILDDQVMDINQQIMDVIITRFNHSNINNDLTSEQFKSIATDIIVGISVDIRDHLNNVSIENGFDNKVIPFQFLGECGANLATLVPEIIESFKVKIQSYSVDRGRITLNNDFYENIGTDIKQDPKYAATDTRLATAVEDRDLQNIHRIMAAIIHTIQGKYLKKLGMNYEHENLESSLEETSHYHKTFVLGNNIDILVYPSRDTDRSVEEDIKPVLERLQYTGRSFIRAIVEKAERKQIENRYQEISTWEDKISNPHAKMKVGKVKDYEQKISKAQEEIKTREAKIEKKIPSLKTPNFLVPTLMFTVGYKDKDQNTIKRKFVEVSVPVLNDSDLLSYTSSEAGAIDAIRDRDEQAFKDNIQEQVYSKELIGHHIYDSERIFSYYIRKPEVIKALVENLRAEIAKDNSLSIEDGSCKIYAMTILSYSTNATCRNCTRIYGTLATDKTEGSFLDLITKEINNTQNLFAYSSSDLKEDNQQREGIRIRSLVIADHDYHEHQKFSKEHPETLVQHGGSFDVKNSSKRSFVEIVSQNTGANEELHSGASFKSGKF